MTLLAPAVDTWTPVCRYDELVPGRGVAVLLGDRAVAVFRLDDGLHAIDNMDPYAGASVLARGLVGCTQRDGVVVTYVASPLRKQRFELETGRDLDGDRHLATWPVRVVDGSVELGTQDSCGGNESETSA